jgi:putative flippase GtrA
MNEAQPSSTDSSSSLFQSLLAPTNGLWGQFARSIVVGVLASIVDFSALYSFTEYGHVHYLQSAAIGFVFGVITNYIFSRYWVFHSRMVSNTTMEFLLFAGMGIVGLLLNELIMWFAHEHAHLHYLMAKVVATGIVFVWNFGSRKMLLFG